MKDGKELLAARKRYNRAKMLHNLADREWQESKVAYETLFMEQQRESEERRRAAQSDFDYKRLEIILEWIIGILGGRSCSGLIEKGFLLVRVHTHNSDEVQLEVDLGGDPPWQEANAQQLISRIPDQAFVDLKQRINEVEAQPTIDMQLTAAAN